MRASVPLQSAAGMGGPAGGAHPSNLSSTGPLHVCSLEKNAGLLTNHEVIVVGKLFNPLCCLLCRSPATCRHCHPCVGGWLRAALLPCPPPQLPTPRYANRCCVPGALKVMPPAAGRGPASVW